MSLSEKTTLPTDRRTTTKITITTIRATDPQNKEHQNQISITTDLESKSTGEVQQSTPKSVTNTHHHVLAAPNRSSTSTTNSKYEKTNTNHSRQRHSQGPPELHQNSAGEARKTTQIRNWLRSLKTNKIRPRSEGKRKLNLEAKREKKKNDNGEKGKKKNEMEAQWNTN
ncbi:hypothetical protein P8452_13093 [Trifolium repens]|nr:hypothetical protein P8452_13093 [Trifolium repens]